MMKGRTENTRKEIGPPGEGIFMKTRYMMTEMPVSVVLAIFDIFAHGARLFCCNCSGA